MKKGNLKTTLKTIFFATIVSFILNSCNKTENEITEKMTVEGVTEICNKYGFKFQKHNQINQNIINQSNIKSYEELEKILQTFSIDYTETNSSYYLKTGEPRLVKTSTYALDGPGSGYDMSVEHWFYGVPAGIRYIATFNNNTGITGANSHMFGFTLLGNYEQISYVTSSFVLNGFRYYRVTYRGNFSYGVYFGTFTGDVLSVPYDIVVEFRRPVSGTGSTVTPTFYRIYQKK